VIKWIKGLFNRNDFQEEAKTEEIEIVDWFEKWLETKERLNNGDFTKEELQTIENKARIFEEERKEKNKILRKINKWLKDEYRTYEQGYELLQKYSKCELLNWLHYSRMYRLSFPYRQETYNQDVSQELNFIGWEKANLKKSVKCDIGYFRSILDKWTFSDKERKVLKA